MTLPMYIYTFYDVYLSSNKNLNATIYRVIYTMGEYKILKCAATRTLLNTDSNYVITTWIKTFFFFFILVVLVGTPKTCR